MSDHEPCIIFVPGIRAKPKPEIQVEQLRRCLHFSVMQAGASSEESEALAAAFRIAGWSYSFYGVHQELYVNLGY